MAQSLGETAENGGFGAGKGKGRPPNFLPTDIGYPALPVIRSAKIVLYLFQGPL
jgi:hypothetical protein